MRGDANISAASDLVSPDIIVRSPVNMAGFRVLRGLHVHPSPFPFALFVAFAQHMALHQEQAFGTAGYNMAVNVRQSVV